MDLEEVGCGGIDWIDLAENRDRRWAIARVVLDFRLP
jgi:hypothetical protein